MIVAVIDLGKTNSKVALVDTTHAQELQVLTQVTTVNENTPYPSLDHKSIEDFVFTALRELGNQHTIDAVTVTTHGATAALLNAQGKLAMPVMDYEYRGVDESRADYNRHRQPFSATGSPASPGGLNIGAQMYWQQTRFPGEFATVQTVLTWPQYWVYILTGKKHNDATSLGAHTDLYQPRLKQYSTLVNELNWHTLMPPTRRSGQLSGRLLPDNAKKTGLPETTPVYTGIHDSNASLVPHLIAHSAPFTVLSTGTWFISMAIGGKATPLDESRDTLLNVNAYGDPVPSARFMGGRERELLGISENSTETALEELLSQKTPPLLLPSVVPDTGPFPDTSTIWINPVEDGPIRDSAVTLYLALMTCECLKLIGSDGPTYIEGPLAHDRHFTQMLAAVSKRAVYVSASQTGTSVGAAMLINPPETVPEYTQTGIDNRRCKLLDAYASLWLEQLQSHAL